jgi:hypothetical protein
MKRIVSIALVAACAALVAACVIDMSPPPSHATAAPPRTVPAASASVTPAPTASAAPVAVETSVAPSATPDGGEIADAARE